MKVRDGFNPPRSLQNNRLDGQILNIQKQLPSINYYMILKKIRCSKADSSFSVENNHN